MKVWGAIGKLVFVGVVVAVIAFGTNAYSAKPDGGCEKPKVCPKLWAPVICDDGKVYPNACWAQKRCATGCVPYDEGLYRDNAKQAGCDKPKVCPKLWAPVICDDGKVYPNECWARKRCATGCVPYDG